MDKKNVFSRIRFVTFDQISKIKICHMVASDPEAIEGRRRLIAVDVLEYKEADEDVFIDNYGAASDEYVDSGLVEAGVRTGVTQSGTEDVE